MFCIGPAFAGPSVALIRFETRFGRSLEQRSQLPLQRHTAQMRPDMVETLARQLQANVSDSARFTAPRDLECSFYDRHTWHYHE
jgi:hypothetical protein